MPKILIADQDRASAETLRAQITGISDEISVMQTDSSNEALDLFERTKPDVVFINIALNGANGLVVARQMTHMSVNTKIYILTEYDYFSYVQEAITIGVKEYILKPILPDKLHRILDQNFPGLNKKTIHKTNSDRKKVAYMDDGLQRGYASRTDVIFFNDDYQTELVHELQFMDFTEARREGHMIFNRFYDITDDVDTYREILLELFVVINRCIKNVFGKSTKFSMLANLSNLFKSTDKETLLTAACEQFDTAMNRMEEEKLMEADELKLRVFNYLNRNTAYDMSLNSLAENMGVSATYLSRKYKEWTGNTFSEYITNHRMNAAKTLLLTTQETVKAIGAKVGYPDSNYFCRVFKKKTGQSPQYYRLVNS